MRRFLQLMMVAIGLVAFGDANAQIPDGSVCPEWTGTDYNGVEWSIHDVLAEGKPVIIDISATWCEPCWNYHQTGVLEDLYEAYGPDGTDELMVFWVEGDEDTDTADLEGTGGNTQGDWTAGVNYPIIDDAAISDALQVSAFPTHLLICPDRLTRDIGISSGTGIYSSVDAMYSAAMETSCMSATESTGSSLRTVADSSEPCSPVYEVSVDVINLGTENLSNATVVATGCANCPQTENWSGDLGSYEYGEVTFSQIEVAGDTDVTFTMTSTGDTDLSDNTEAAMLSYDGHEHTTRFTVNLTTDNWPYETTWELRDASGATVRSGGPYGVDQAAAQDPISVFEDFSVDGDLGCWEFVMNDVFGDGLNGSIWTGGVDGQISVQSVNQDGTGYTFYGNNGTSGFVQETANGSVNVVSVDEKDALQASMNVFPNPITSNSKLAFTLNSADVVSYQVVDLLGKVVISENLGTLPAGPRSEELNIANLESGIYMIQLTAGTSTASMKLTLAK